LKPCQGRKNALSRLWLEGHSRNDKLQELKSRRFSQGSPLFKGIAQTDGVKVCHLIAEKMQAISS
jgi:hypothetical protein